LTSIHRVLVVEDHQPFRRAICELLQERPDVRIVGEAGDGLEAVRQAEALRPDVVMLDISLPKMNGLEVARRIREVVPDARLLFVTVESSLEVVEQAFRNGAHGYVYKPRVQRDVLPVFDAIIRGGQFVSGGLERIDRGDSLAAHRHELVFCSSDTVLLDAFGRFIGTHLLGGDVVIVVMTDAHHQSLRHRLRARHPDLARAIREERYVAISIDRLLETMMVDNWPDPTRFERAAEELVAEAAPRATSRRGRVAACGEGAPTLWVRGHAEAAIELERLWDGFAASRQMDLLCVYPLAARDSDARAVRRLCAEHTSVEIS
jgi:DNA-binding NarL/FixJ family response regulator